MWQDSGASLLTVWRLVPSASNYINVETFGAVAALSAKDCCQGKDEGNQSKNSLKEWVRDDRSDRRHYFLSQVSHPFVPFAGRLMHSHLPPTSLIYKANTV